MQYDQALKIFHDLFNQNDSLYETYGKCSKIGNCRATATENAVTELVGDRNIISIVLNVLKQDQLLDCEEWVIIQVNLGYRSTKEDPKPGTKVNQTFWVSNNQNYPETVYSGILWHTVLINLESFHWLIDRGIATRVGIKMSGNTSINYKGQMGNDPIDLDNDPSIDYVGTLDNLLANKITPANISYSPSGNETNNKLRAYIFWDEWITDREECRLRNKQVNAVLPNAAKQIHDPGRYANGSLREALYSYPDVTNYQEMIQHLDSLDLVLCDSVDTSSDDICDQDDQDDQTEITSRLDIDGLKHLLDQCEDSDLKSQCLWLAEPFGNAAISYIEGMQYRDDNGIDGYATEKLEGKDYFHLDNPEKQGSTGDQILRGKDGSIYHISRSFCPEGTTSESVAFLKRLNQIWLSCENPKQSGESYRSYHDRIIDLTQSVSLKSTIQTIESYYDLPKRFKFVAPKQHRDQQNESGYLGSDGEMSYYAKLMFLMSECVTNKSYEENEEGKKVLVTHSTYRLNTTAMRKKVATQLLTRAFYEHIGTIKRLSSNIYDAAEIFIKSEKGRQQIIDFATVCKDFKDFVNGLLPDNLEEPNLAVYTRYRQESEKDLIMPSPEWRINKMPKREPYKVSFRNGIFDLITKEFTLGHPPNINCNIYYDFDYRDVPKEDHGKTITEFCKKQANTVEVEYWGLLPHVNRIQVLGLGWKLNRCIYHQGQQQSGKSTGLAICLHSQNHNEQEDTVVNYTGEELTLFETEAKPVRARLMNALWAVFNEADPMPVRVKPNTIKELTGKSHVDCLILEFADKYIKRAKHRIHAGIIVVSNDWVFSKKQQLEIMSRRTIMIRYKRPEGFKQDSDFEKDWITSEMQEKLILDCCNTFTEDDIKLLQDHTDHDNEDPSLCYLPEARIAALDFMTSEATDNLWDCFDEWFNYVPSTNTEKDVFLSYDALAYLVQIYMLEEIGKDERNYKRIENRRLGLEIHKWAEKRKYSMRKDQRKGESVSGTRKESQRLKHSHSDNTTKPMKGIYRLEPTGRALELVAKCLTSGGAIAYHYNGSDLKDYVREFEALPNS